MAELIWPGKYDAGGDRVATPREAPDLVVREAHGGAAGPPNLLILGDNLPVMAALLARIGGRVDLIYADPPFATGADYVYRRDGGETKAFCDSWPGGLDGFLAMLAPRLELMRDLLSPRGSFYLHVDPTVGHAVKLLCDEVFGPECFQREIVWRIGWLSGYKTQARNWIRNHDLIFFYTRDPRDFTFHKQYTPYPEGYRRRDGSLPKGAGMPLEDVWNANSSENALTGEESLDSIQIKSFSREKTGYPTQKNESLLKRIVSASSNPGDLVADFFCGSGTTLVAAEKLERRWIGCDEGALAIDVARRRLLGLPDLRPFELRALGEYPPVGAGPRAGVR